MDSPVKPPRNRKAEAKRAKAKLVGRVSDLAAARHDGSLGDEHIKLAQVLIMCSLPHSQTDKQQIVRKARLVLTLGAENWAFNTIVRLWWRAGVLTRSRLVGTNAVAEA